MPEPYSKESTDYVLLYPLCKEISKNYCKNIHPNIITIANLILSVLLIYYLHITKFDIPINNMIIVILLFILRAILDGLDGTVARMYNKTSEFGSKLDEYCDIIFFVGLMYIIYDESFIYSILILIQIVIFYFTNIAYKYKEILHDNTIIVTPMIIIIMFIIKEKKA